MQEDQCRIDTKLVFEQGLVQLRQEAPPPREAGKSTTSNLRLVAPSVVTASLVPPC